MLLGWNWLRIVPSCCLWYLRRWTYGSATTVLYESEGTWKEKDVAYFKAVYRVTSGATENFQENTIMISGLCLTFQLSTTWPSPARDTCLAEVCLNSKRGYFLERRIIAMWAACCHGSKHRCDNLFAYASRRMHTPLVKYMIDCCTECWFSIWKPIKLFMGKNEAFVKLEHAQLYCSSCHDVSYINMYFEC
jgi:hypothetical protein